jgi:hypothetical protein
VPHRVHTMHPMRSSNRVQDGPTTSWNTAFSKFRDIAIWREAVASLAVSPRMKFLAMSASASLVLPGGECRS